MTVRAPGKVRLRVTEMTGVTSIAEAERGPHVRALVVSREVLQKAVGWAEALGWRNPDRSHTLRHLPRAVIPALVSTLRSALEGEPATPSGSRARMNIQSTMHDYFATAKNRRQLVQVLDFLAAGGELDVEGI